MRAMTLVKGMMLALGAMLLCSCSDDNDSKIAKTRFEPIPFTTEEQAALNATEPFSLDLFKHYSKLSSNPNVAISPLSATFSMAMVANGATGETQAEILTALGFNGESGLEDLNSYARRMMQNIGKVDPSTEAIMANAMFYKKGLEVGKFFMDRIKDDYNADFLSFLPDEYVGAIDD